MPTKYFFGGQNVGRIDENGEYLSLIFKQTHAISGFHPRPFSERP